MGTGEAVPVTKAPVGGAAGLLIPLRWACPFRGSFPYGGPRGEAPWRVRDNGVRTAFPPGRSPGPPAGAADGRGLHNARRTFRDPDRDHRRRPRRLRGGPGGCPARCGGDRRRLRRPRRSFGPHRLRALEDPDRHGRGDDHLRLLLRGAGHHRRRRHTAHRAGRPGRRRGPRQGQPTGQAPRARPVPRHHRLRHPGRRPRDARPGPAGRAPGRRRLPAGRRHRRRRHGGAADRRRRADRDRRPPPGDPGRAARRRAHPELDPGLRPRRAARGAHRRRLRCHRRRVRRGLPGARLPRHPRLLPRPGAAGRGPGRRRRPGGRLPTSRDERHGPLPRPVGQAGRRPGRGDARRRPRHHRFALPDGGRRDPEHRGHGPGGGRRTAQGLRARPHRPGLAHQRPRRLRGR
ncbi:hypothetical protein SBADM41S_02666 [Streptomyces badius]